MAGSAGAELHALSEDRPLTGVLAGRIEARYQLAARRLASGGIDIDINIGEIGRVAKATSSASAINRTPARVSQAPERKILINPAMA